VIGKPRAKNARNLAGSIELGARSKETGGSREPGARPPYVPLHAPGSPLLRLRKPAARRSDCIDNKCCQLQTGRGAAFELKIFYERQITRGSADQLPLSKSSSAKAKGIAIAAATVPAVM
jgi:hypothetical protein